MRPIFKARSALILAVLAAWACSPAQGDDAGARPAADPTAENAQVAGTPSSPAPARPAHGTAWVVFGADTVVAEVAATNDQRAQGLMYRQEVPDGTGMLFVFEESAVRSFWMENTYVALDIAFMDPGFRIVDIQQMEPLTTDFHESRAPAMFALEVRKGWFAEKGIGVGARPQIVFSAR